MRGVESFESASRFCTAFDELSDYLKVRRRREHPPSLSERRQAFAERWRALIVELCVAVVEGVVILTIAATSSSET